MDMTRGEIQDLLVKFAAEQPKYKDALKKNPKEVIYKQFGIQVPGNTKVQVLQESADQIYVVLPHVVESGAELSDADLEAVAGGHTIVKEAECGGDGTFQTVNSFEASIG
jgi:hypothetical protein